MKKLSLLLAILLIVSFGVSAAAADTSFDITTSVGTISEVKIGDGGLTPTLKSEFEGITEKSSVEFGTGGELGYNYPLGVYAMTNVSGTYTVSTTAAPLKHETSNFILKYTVSVDSTDYVVDSASGEDITFISNFIQGGGLSFASQNFNVILSELDLDAAESGDYSSTWTIELIKN